MLLALSQRKERSQLDIFHVVGSELKLLDCLLFREAVESNISRRTEFPIAHQLYIQKDKVALDLAYRGSHLNLVFVALESVRTINV